MSVQPTVALRVHLAQAQGPLDKGHSNPKRRVVVVSSALVMAPAMMTTLGYRGRNTWQGLMMLHGLLQERMLGRLPIAPCTRCSALCGLREGNSSGILAYCQTRESMLGISLWYVIWWEGGEKQCKLNYICAGNARQSYACFSR